ncbi:hypothetical protein NO1_1726 [Candidatus Termititenax aidoneus]|uniref:DUF5675 domain-containing protein n=1 Tax=Termititenax aidoneus TaxID=2218524 RepID=A0A388TD37_TERA1|nr:hypothetical protein NO1_1726 [Candidatus Termititenax aidoneus]
MLKAISNIILTFLRFFWEKGKKILLKNITAAASTGKIYIEYRKTKRTTMSGVPYSEGVLRVVDKDGSIIWQRAARSGGFGKGDLPDGEYKAVWFTWTQAKGMVQFGVGWLLSLLPQFKTDRTQICIHLDQPPRGSEACIVFDAADKADAEASGKMFESLLAKYQEIEMDVR